MDVLQKLNSPHTSPQELDIALATCVEPAHHLSFIADFMEAGGEKVVQRLRKKATEEGKDQNCRALVSALKANSGASGPSGPS